MVAELVDSLGVPASLTGPQAAVVCCVIVVGVLLVSFILYRVGLL